jgi:hypothetical protein
MGAVPAGAGAGASSLETSDKFARSDSWGLSEEAVALHKRRLLAFYSVHAPHKAHADNVAAAWQLFGVRIWDELERKYRGKTAGFRPSGPDGATSAGDGTGPAEAAPRAP